MTDDSNPPSRDLSDEGPHSAKAKPAIFPDNVQFWYETVRAFGATSYGGSEFGEVLATTSRIVSGDFDSWYDQWHATAERVAKEAQDQLTHGHRISARDGFLRASTYYRLSEFFLHGNPGDPRITSAYQKSVQAYKACAALFDPPIEPVEIPYEHIREAHRGAHCQRWRLRLWRNQPRRRPSGTARGCGSGNSGKGCARDRRYARGSDEGTSNSGVGPYAWHVCHGRFDPASIRGGSSRLPSARWCRGSHLLPDPCLRG
jgi:hypothetical protein